MKYYRLLLQSLAFIKLLQFIKLLKSFGTKLNEEKIRKLFVLIFMHDLIVQGVS